MNPTLEVTFTSAATALLAALGEDVTHTPVGGTARTIRAVLDSAVQAVGDPFSERMETQWRVTAAASANVAIGDRIATALKAWTVTQLEANDGITATFSLREA